MRVEIELQLEAGLAALSAEVAKISGDAAKAERVLALVNRRGNPLSKADRELVLKVRSAAQHRLARTAQHRLARTASPAAACPT